MEYLTCTICGSPDKRSNEFNYRLTNRNLAASRENYCKHCKRILNLVDNTDHVESREQKQKKMFSETWEKNRDIISRSSCFKSTAHMKKNIAFGINNYLIVRKMYSMIQMFTN